jgi:hypothetical protein
LTFKKNTLFIETKRVLFLLDRRIDAKTEISIAVLGERGDMAGARYGGGKGAGVGCDIAE